jgi:hypothetical protein
MAGLKLVVMMTVITRDEELSKLGQVAGLPSLLLRGEIGQRLQAYRLDDLIGQLPFHRFDFMAGGFTPLS